MLFHVSSLPDAALVPHHKLQQPLAAAVATTWRQQALLDQARVALVGKATWFLMQELVVAGDAGAW